MSEIGGEIFVFVVSQDKIISFPKEEKTWEDIVGCHLKDLGLEFDRQKKIGEGYTDIFVYGNPPKIIELKLENSMRSVLKAIGQLMYYSHYYPLAEKYIFVPGGVPRHLLPVLSRNGIKEWELPPIRYFEIESTKKQDHSLSKLVSLGIARNRGHALGLVLKKGFEVLLQAEDEGLIEDEA